MDRICTIEGCVQPHRARGLCSTHYNQAHQPDRHRQVMRVCDTCGVEYLTMRPDGRFCSLLCRDLWRIDQPDDPMHSLQLVCRLPVDHPVRVLIRTRHQQRSPLRRAYESEDWAQVLDCLEQQAVKVEDCWLWPRRTESGYGVILIGTKAFRVHRLAKAASLARPIPSHHPVHHTCAETMCYNPVHLQVVTPIENTAEMLERKYYQERIASLEQALSTYAPGHSLLRAKGISPAA